MAADSTSSLQTLFTAALRDASKALERPALQDETQELINSTLKSLNLVLRCVELSGMFSPNESLDDLSTASIPYLALHYLIVELIGKLRATDHAERIQHIVESQRHLHIFSEQIHQYGIVSKQDQKVFLRRMNEVKDPGVRRELKIQQFKAEKEAKNRLEALFRGKSHSFSSDNESDIIQSILSLPKPFSEEAGEHPDEENLRDTYMLIIRLIWMRSQTQLESLNNELDLLHTAPPLPSSSQPGQPSDDTTWRLDRTPVTGGLDGGGPLMDSSGRPVRPFVILPGNTLSDRARFQAHVFRPDHRLPTMTVDEYLEKEKGQGNIISGGGPRSLNALTETEQLTIDSEMEGTLNGETKAEEKRQRDERWARFTDIHPKGEGNTMNRG